MGERGDKHRRRREESKILVRMSEKVIWNYTINYLPEKAYDTHKPMYIHSHVLSEVKLLTGVKDH